MCVYRNGGEGHSLQQTVVQQACRIESDNTQPLRMLLKHELTSGVRYLDNFNISLAVN